MDEPILLMQNITKVYSNGFTANSNVTLSCQKGEIHALLGENGAGKTTLMKMLFGFEEPTEGKIFIKGKEVKFKGALDAIEHAGYRKGGSHKSRFQAPRDGVGCRRTHQDGSGRQPDFVHY